MRLDPLPVEGCDTGGIRLQLSRKMGIGVVFGLLLVLGAGWFSYRQWKQASSFEGAVTSSVADFLPGTVRLVEGLWVARQQNGEFFVFLNRDPHKGQPLNWVESKGLFIQAAYYGIDGKCQGGPCNGDPPGGLYRVGSHLEGQTLTVYPQKIISGGFNPEPTWMTDLRHFFGRRLPNAPSPAERP